MPVKACPGHDPGPQCRTPINLPLWRLMASRKKNRVRVILSPSEGSAFFRTCVEIGRWCFETTNQKQILRRSAPQNDIATQSLAGGGQRGACDPGLPGMTPELFNRFRKQDTRLCKRSWLRSGHGRFLSTVQRQCGAFFCVGECRDLA
jgi:hypothetical protein